MPCLLNEASITNRWEMRAVNLAHGEEAERLAVDMKRKKAKELSRQEILASRLAALTAAEDAEEAEESERLLAEAKRGTQVVTTPKGSVIEDSVIPASPAASNHSGI